METEIDAALRRLAATDHPGLDGMEDAVLAGLRARREARTGIRMAAIAGIGAVALGAAAAGPGTSPASAAAPFGGAASLAPSTLLLAER
ncbi:MULTISPECIES: hypothetical protein [Sphingomonas]|uniref:Uncharacterized protein n=1 Tax=Sphingomonas leidyi TaxID=68569 RepID=A0A7X5V117_9SPHN|nr:MULTISPECIES: hypothetical protein [Sphingomonas]MBN8810269.1 hypothetical protein [Sphingomonas sp.]NIJ65560.1 hypothetical protein [Sphingomonas leidyi]OJY50825.1 MAG: hypothetical protein BGP17_20730 [Sphingomonas sp. 67-41]